MSAGLQGTIVEQKKAFLQTRKHVLSHGIAPSERLRTIAEDNDIDLSVLKDVLNKGTLQLAMNMALTPLRLICLVNRDLKQHSRRVYSRQMIEHVAEQIDLLYWESGVRPVDEDEDDDAETEEEDSNALYQSDDLALDSNIAKLPATLPSASQDSEVDQDDYLAAVSRLQDLSARRQALQNRLNTYRTLVSLLEPYRKPKENIQPNLVWKDAPIAPELAKTRTLAIRVAGRVAERFEDVQVPATAEENEEEDIDMGRLMEERKRKVGSVLSSW